MIKKVSVEIKRFINEYVLLSQYYATFLNHGNVFQFIPLIKVSEYP